MKSYDEVKKEQFEFTKNFSDKKMVRHIKLINFFKNILNEKFFWFMSILPMSLIWSIFIWLGFFELDIITVFFFTLTHFLYWYFIGKKEANKIIDESRPELELHIQALDEIRKERNL
jgi:hypothetical protein